jgi:hypothetical protein
MQGQSMQEAGLLLLCLDFTKRFWIFIDTSVRTSDLAQTRIGIKLRKTKITGVWSHNITDPIRAIVTKIFQKSFLNSNPQHRQACEDKAKNVHEQASV